jgi:hypothetical protein
MDESVMDQVLQTLESTTLAAVIRGEVPEYLAWEGWVFPSIEIVHVFALSLVFGSIFMLDMRLLGLTHRDSAVTALSRAVLPWTWVAFGVAAASGGLMFVSKAGTYFHNGPFRLKFVLMLVAAINMLLFHFGIYRTVTEWNNAMPPHSARLAGALSILLWLAVIFCGRWIGFTT